MYIYILVYVYMYVYTNMYTQRWVNHVAPQFFSHACLFDQKKFLLEWWCYSHVYYFAWWRVSAFSNQAVESVGFSGRSSLETALILEPSPYESLRIGACRLVGLGISVKTRSSLLTANDFRASSLSDSCAGLSSNLIVLCRGFGGFADSSVDSSGSSATDGGGGGA